MLLTINFGMLKERSSTVKKRSILFNPVLFKLMTVKPIKILWELLCYTFQKRQYLKKLIYSMINIKA